MNTVELKQLKYFMHVAELGSYTRAAEVIDVAQPVLSRQIRQLEIELRQNLLIRHGRGVVLTDSGRTLLKHVNIIMDQIDEAYEDLSLSDGKLAGHITIGLPPTVAKLIAIDLVRAFKQRLPLAHLTIEEGLTVHIEENLGLGRMDIGLLNNPTFSPNIDTKLIIEEELYLIAKKGYFPHQPECMDLKELAAIPLIMPTLPNPFRVLVQAQMAEIGLKPQIDWEINSVGTIVKLVNEGVGCAVLSKYCLGLVKDGDNMEAIRIQNPALVNRLYVGYSAKRATTRLQKEMLQLVEEMCQRYF